MIVWYAECRDCTLSHYTPATGATLVMTFDDQYERNRWATQHRNTLGHSTLEYMRRLPDQEESE